MTLVIKTIASSVQEVVDYYEKDESLVEGQDKYYTEDGVISEVDKMTHAVWHGKAATALGLSGVVSKEDFRSLSHGYKPGQEEAKENRVRWERPKSADHERYGHDLVFSAPKSVSMGLHIGGDQRLFDAHMEAVKETLDVAEEYYGQARIQKDGDRQVISTKNIAVALIPHHTSRDGDPNLHTHAYVMNCTEGPDGKWRSLRHETLVNAGWLGSHYRQVLAEKAQALGYEIEITKDGFELKGYSRKQIEAFSKRHKAIEKKVKDAGLTLNSENKKKAVLSTRKAKTDVGQKLEDLQDAWREEAQRHGIGSLDSSKPKNVRVNAGEAEAEVESAIAHWSERSVSFTKSKIYQYAFKHVKRTKFPVEPVTQAIDRNKSLIPHGGEDSFTTAPALKREIEIIRRWMNGQRKAEPFVKSPKTEGMSDLNKGQTRAVVSTLKSKDLHQIWYGLSGVGKTTALKELAKQLEGTGVTIKGFAPTIPAAEELEASLGIEASTVQSLILSKPEFKKDQLWIVDEGGLLSSQMMLKMQKKADSVGARLLLVGDKGQNSAIQAGSPFRALIDHGATTHRIKEIVRQGGSVQKEAVQLIAKGDGEGALKLLEENGYIKEIGNSKDRAEAIANEYLALSDKQREKTLLVSGTNEERANITKAIRAGLRKKKS
ncbi:MAG: MobF family relaxase [Alphaproteobacteria bacterium]